MVTEGSASGQRRKDRHNGTALLVRMPTELHMQIQAFCAAEDRNMAQVVRLALREFFDRQEGEPRVNYVGPDPIVQCAFPPCGNTLRRSDFDGPQWCSKEHREATSGV